MLRKLLTFTAASLLLSFSASAQDSCSSLSVEMTPQADGLYDLLVVEITDSEPNRPTWLLGGLSNKPTTIAYSPSLILNVELSIPVLNAYLGLTNELGNYEQSYNVPPNIDLTLYVQAITLDYERIDNGLMNFSFCTSNPLTVEM